MKKQNIILSMTLLGVVLILLMINCGNHDQTDATFSIVFNNLTDESVSGICFSIINPPPIADETKVNIELSQSLDPICDFGINNESQLTFAILIKDGEIPEGEIATMIAESDYSSNIEIVDVCDNLGNPIDPEDVSMSIVKQ